VKKVLTQQEERFIRWRYGDKADAMIQMLLVLSLRDKMEHYGGQLFAVIFGFVLLSVQVFVPPHRWHGLILFIPLIIWSWVAWSGYERTKQQVKIEQRHLAELDIELALQSRQMKVPKDLSDWLKKQG